MIGGDGDDRARAGGLHQPIDDPIDRCDLPVVRRRPKSLFQIRRRIVRIVRIEQMRPQKVGLAAGGCQPRVRARRHLVAPPLDRPVAILAGASHPEAGVVDVEAAIEARRRSDLRIQDERADERGRVITLPAQQVGQVRHGGRERRPEVGDAMEEWIRAAEDRRMRDGRDRCLRVGPREDRRRPRQRVERRRQPARRSEEPHPIRAGRVERDQQDARLPLDEPVRRLAQDERVAERDRQHGECDYRTHEKGRRQACPIAIWNWQFGIWNACSNSKFRLLNSKLSE